MRSFLKAIPVAAVLALTATPAQAQSDLCITPGNGLTGTFCVGYLFSQSGAQLAANQFSLFVGVYGAPYTSYTQSRITDIGLFNLGSATVTGLAGSAGVNGATQIGGAVNPSPTSFQYNSSINNLFTGGISVTQNGGVSSNPQTAGIVGPSGTTNGAYKTADNCNAFLGACDAVRFDFNYTGTLNLANAGFAFFAQGEFSGRCYNQPNTGNAYVCGTDITRINQVPEPSTYALMASGLLAMGFAARRRRRA